MNHVKMFMSIFYSTDYHIISLQHDLDRFSEWYKFNNVSLEVSKCVFMSFNRSKSHINFQYDIDGISLYSVNQIWDLG